MAARRPVHVSLFANFVQANDARISGLPLLLGADPVDERVPELLTGNYAEHWPTL